MFMGLYLLDKKPHGISIQEAYSSIRSWYQAYSEELASRRVDHTYAQKSIALIRALPEGIQLSDIEMKAVFFEVICGLLEWGYHESDGRYKMAAYAHAAIEAHGGYIERSDNDTQRLKESILWPFFKR